jgi:hypothetical protein
MHPGRSLRSKGALALAAALWLVLLHAGAGRAQSDPLPCAGTPIVVYGLDDPEAASACQVVKDALAFLSDSGLDTSVPAELRFVEKLPGVPPGTTSFGCYARSERRIYMLSLAACRSAATELPVDAPVHRGLVAHEVAHHVAATNFRVPQPTRVAHEYIAYVTMYATMTADVRERVLALFPGSGFQSEREIGLTRYLLGPQRFGANAYRHFMRAGNGAAFIERVLSGRALADEEPP